MVSSIAQYLEDNSNQISDLTSEISNLTRQIEKLISTLPKVEVHFGPTPPDNPIEGDLWYNTTEERLYVYVTE